MAEPPEGDSTNTANVHGGDGGIAVAGDRNIVIVIGRESRAAQELLEDYLKRLRGRISLLPLGAITRRGASDEDVALTEVYTSLDVTGVVQSWRNPRAARGSAEDRERLAVTVPLGPLALAALEERVRAEKGSGVPRRARDVVPDAGLEGSLVHDLELPGELRVIRALTAVEVAGGNARLVLTGVAGSGKSTFAKHLCLCMIGELQGDAELGLATLNGTDPGGQPWPAASRPWLVDAAYPLYVECRQYVRSPQFRARNDGDGDPASALLRFLECEVAGRGLDVPPSDEVSAALRKVLCSGSALLVLDGLDEVEEADAHRERLCAQVTALLRTYDTMRVLVTARPYAYRPASPWRLGGADFVEAQLADFDSPHVEAFCRRWYARLVQRALVDADAAAERAADLTTQVTMPGMRALSANPLMLTMVADLHWSQGGVLPPGRAQLYERSVELLLDRWNQRRGLTDEKALADDLGLSLPEILSALEELALEVHATAPDGTQAADIDAGVLWKVLNRHRPPGQRADEARIMGYLHTRSGILIGESPEVYRFPHLTFQEYLAASQLTQDPDFPAEAVRLATADPARWREVTAFLAGAVASTPMMIWALIEGLAAEPPGAAADAPSSDDPRFWLAHFAGQAIMAHRLWQGPTPVQARKLAVVRAWLQRTLDVGALPVSDRGACGRALARLGDGRHGVGLRSDGVADIAWIALPAGMFAMGSDDGRPGQPTTVPPFRIAKYPVTVAQFRPFVDPGGGGYGSEALWSADGRHWRERQRRTQPQFWGDPRFSDDNQPVVGVSWYEAVAYCNWLSERRGEAIRLPTEAEWEYAARGQDDRRYPWGDDWDVERCNTAVSGILRTTAVGMYPLPDGYWTARPDVGEDPLDMSGNVWEWTSTRWRGQLDKPADDSLTGTASRVVRGGSWDDDPRSARSASRSHSAPAATWNNFGFRVAAPTS